MRINVGREVGGSTKTAEVGSAENRPDKHKKKTNIRILSS